MLFSLLVYAMIERAERVLECKLKENERLMKMTNLERKITFGIFHRRILFNDPINHVNKKCEY